MLRAIKQRDSFSDFEKSFPFALFDFRRKTMCSDDDGNRAMPGKRRRFSSEVFAQEGPMIRILATVCAIGILAGAARADVIPKGLEAGCNPCTFLTAGGQSIQLDLTVDEDGYVTSVSFDGTPYSIESDVQLLAWNSPPLVRVKFAGLDRSDIYAVQKFRGAKNSENYYFLHDAEGMHLLGDAPTLRFNTDRNVFEGSVGFVGGAEISSYDIRNRKLVLLGTEQVVVGDE